MNRNNEEYFAQVLKIMEAEKQSEPYSHLSIEQRRIMLNIDYAITHDLADIALDNLADLNDVIRMNNESLASYKSQSNWAIPLGIIGLVLTIIFGLTSALRPISNMRLKAQIEEAVNQAIQDEEE